MEVRISRDVLYYVDMLFEFIELWPKAFLWLETSNVTSHRSLVVLRETPTWGKFMSSNGTLMSSREGIQPEGCSLPLNRKRFSLQRDGGAA